MKKNRAKLLTLFLLLSIAVLAACSGNTPPANSAAPPPQGPSAAPASPDAAPAVPSSAEGVSAPEVTTVTVAITSEEKPNSFTDENGQLTGYDVELLQKLDEQIPEYAFVLESVEGDAQAIGIDTGKYVLITEARMRTPEREEKYLFTEENVGAAAMKIVVREDETGINSLGDLVGRSVAPVSPNGGIFNLFTAYNNSHDAQITITTQEGLSPAQAFTDVAEGKYDACVYPSPPFMEIKETLGLAIKQSATASVDPTYFALAKNQTDLQQRIDAALRELKADGWLGELSVNYFGEDVFLLEVPE